MAEGDWDRLRVGHVVVVAVDVMCLDVDECDLIELVDAFCLVIDDPRFVADDTCFIVGVIRFVEVCLTVVVCLAEVDLVLIEEVCAVS